MIQQLDQILDKLQQSQNLLLTTHKNCDGDGLGAILGLFHSLKEAGKKVSVMTIDGIPKKYSFLNGDIHTQTYEDLKNPKLSYDLCLIFDTNDNRLVEPLFTDLINTNCEVLFIDHHPLLGSGPLPTEGSYVDTTAASTGEIAFQMIEKLKLPLNPLSAEALYTSICFDTQLFRYIKSSAKSHVICAELLKYLQHPEKVHQHLFSTYTVGKTMFLSEVLGNIDLYNNDQVAFLVVTLDQLKKYNLEPDESRDIIDMVMNINSLEAAILFREESSNTYKISLRSKGKIKVLEIAEKYEGGGHPYAAGALLRGPIQKLREQLLQYIQTELNPSKK